MKGGDNVQVKLKKTGYRKAIIITLSITMLSLLILGCPQKKTDEINKDASKEEKETGIEFKNQELSISTEMLEENLFDKDIQIIDVRSEEDYSNSHIKGAINIPIEKTVDDESEIPGMVTTKEKFEKLISDSGISNDTRIVLYDAGSAPFAGRFFWVFEYFGNYKAAVLDGGFKKWQGEGRDISKEVTETGKSDFKATVNKDVNITFKEVKEIIEEEDDNVIFVDTRPVNEWLTGHLPAAVRLDWVVLFTKDDHPVLKPAEELQKIFDDAGITRDKDLVLY